MSEQPSAQPPPRPDDREAIMGGCGLLRLRIVAAVTILAVQAIGLALAGCSSSQRGSTTTVTVTASPSTSAVTHQPARAAALAARLKAAGLPVSGLIVYTAATDPNAMLGRQGGYTSKVAWVDQRAEKAGAGKPVTADEHGDVSYGGGIEVFPTAAQARQRGDYIRGFGQPLADGYDYTDGGALLRLSQYLTPAQARAYKAAFITAVAGS
jgi:hypothetical protein